MSIVNKNDLLSSKRLLFEFLVCELDKWRLEIHLERTNLLTKLRLQKILFFVSTIYATRQRHILLDVFNNFYALPYGPVELDIYDSMNKNDFLYISIVGNNCIVKNTEKDFSVLNEEYKEIIIQSIAYLKDKYSNYLFRPAFELVDLTHRWSAWQIAMECAKVLGHNKAKLSTEDILNSTKFY